MDATASRGVCGLHNPNVALRLSLSQLLVVRMEVMELLWQDVRIRDEVKLGSAKPFLHLHVVVTEPVLARDLVALWEVIDALKLVQPFIQVALARTGRP